jgi:hypothetical protein
MPRRFLILLVIVLLVLVALVFGFGLFLGARDRAGFVERFEIFPAEEKLILEPASFDRLPGWREDAVEAALPALLRSCAKLAALPDGAPAGGSGAAAGIAGKAADWRARRPGASSSPASVPGRRAITAIRSACSPATTSLSSTAAAGATAASRCRSTAGRPSW